MKPSFVTKRKRRPVSSDLESSFSSASDALAGATPSARACAHDNDGTHDMLSPSSSTV